MFFYKCFYFPTKVVKDRYLLIYAGALETETNVALIPSYVAERLYF